MKIYNSSDGGKRIWYDKGEIEDLVEAELRKSGFYPTADESRVDLEGFVEEYLQAPLDPYAKLDGDVLGLTEFRRGHSPLVKINGDLTRAAIDADPRTVPTGLLGRWRATVAHEGSHVLLHKMLYTISESQGSLFGEPADNAEVESVQCLKRDVAYAGVGDWREYQANQGMAALMMPRQIFIEVAQEHCDMLGVELLMGEMAADAAYRLSHGLARVFGVSHQAAEIRLKTLGFVCAPGQQTLVVAEHLVH